VKVKAREEGVLSAPRRRSGKEAFTRLELWLRSCGIERDPGGLVTWFPTDFLHTTISDATTQRSEEWLWTAGKLQYRKRRSPIKE
jgi:hypothetical protein